MVEWKQDAYTRKRNLCPRCCISLINGRCPRCDWPGFKLPDGISQKEWELLEKREEKRQRNEKIKHQAQIAVKKALKEGKLKKPERCENCGEIKKLEAHHWSYLPEYWLDVIWLCVKCHRMYQDYSENIMTRKRKPHVPTPEEREQVRRITAEILKKFSDSK